MASQYHNSEAELSKEILHTVAMRMDNNGRLAVRAELGRLLREERRRQRSTMKALAVQAGLVQSMISMVECGVRNPSLDTLLRITAALDVKLSEVLSRAERVAKRR